MAPGDVFIMNDPFDGGMHLPDIFVFKPLYHEGEPAGLRLHGLPPHRRRRPRRRLERLGLDRDLPRGPAHRADEALRGGQAQQDHHDVHREERAPAGAAVRRPARPARRLPHRRDAVRRDRGALRAREDQVLSGRGDRLRRAADAGGAGELPDGEWSFEDWIDDDGIDYGRPIRLFVTIRKKGDHMVVDWTGTDPQVKGAINNTLSFTKAATYTACAPCCRRTSRTTRACSARSR